MARCDPGNLADIATASTLKRVSLGTRIQTHRGKGLHPLSGRLMRMPTAQVDMPGSDDLNCGCVTAPLTGHFCFLHSLLQPQLNERVFLRPIHVDPKRAEFLLDLANRGIAFLSLIAVPLDRFKTLSDNPDPAQIVFSQMLLNGAADVMVIEDVTHPPDPPL